MAIEGPLRELGIHDVFQLLDLSRKTGVLRVRSELRQDEGMVGFDNGRVVLASMRSKIVPLEDVLVEIGRVNAADVQAARERLPLRPGVPIPNLLVELGAITQKELERQARQQVESAVFELMSWSEGYFSFEERSRSELPDGLRVSISTESLLMEGARRIDEWSRIADTVPNADVIPDLAPVGDDREGSALDLLPHEWQVLTMIGGERSLHSIARALGRDEFEIAKIAYGLVRTGVIELRRPARRSSVALAIPADEIARRREAARAHSAGGRHIEAMDELRRAIKVDPTDPELHRELGMSAARGGELTLARSSWEHYLRLVNGAPDANRIRDAVAALSTLISVLETNDAS